MLGAIGADQSATEGEAEDGERGAGLAVGAVGAISHSTTATTTRPAMRALCFFMAG